MEQLINYIHNNVILWSHQECDKALCSANSTLCTLLMHTSVSSALVCSLV